MKLTITNNGTEPFSVSYSDMYKLYNEDEYEGETVVLQPDTSITIDNVEKIHEIQPVPDTPEGGLESDSDFDLDDLDDLDLDDDEIADDEDDEVEETPTGDPEDPDETDDKLLLSQEDFDLNELDSDRTPR